LIILKEETHSKISAVIISAPTFPQLQRNLMMLDEYQIPEWVKSGLNLAPDDLSDLLLNQK
jgi:hypothetical protein